MQAHSRLIVAFARQIFATPPTRPVHSAAGIWCSRREVHARVDTRGIIRVEAAVNRVEGPVIETSSLMKARVGGHTGIPQQRTPLPTAIPIRGTSIRSRRSIRARRIERRERRVIPEAPSGPHSRRRQVHDRGEMGLEQGLRVLEKVFECAGDGGVLVRPEEEFGLGGAGVVAEEGAHAACGGAGGEDAEVWKA